MKVSSHGFLCKCFIQLGVAQVDYNIQLTRRLPNYRRHLIHVLEYFFVGLHSPTLTYTHARTNARTHERMRTHAHPRAHTHTHTHTHTRTHARTHARTNARTHERMQTQTHEYSMVWRGYTCLLNCSSYPFLPYFTYSHYDPLTIWIYISRHLPYFSLTVSLNTPG